ncbi:MAG: hypothetical protein NTY28_02165, partial [Janthinobacterium sp.]|nr:hypothetical protein [Janthinobacterium sp.]
MHGRRQLLGRGAARHAQGGRDDVQGRRRRCLLVLAVFALCWGGAIWYWRASTRVPTAGDLAGAMLVLPLSLLLAFWLGKKLLARLAAGPAMAAAATAAPQAQAAPTA